MSIPDYQSLMLPVLVAASKGEVRIGQVVEELADQLKLSPEERSELLPSGRQTVFSNRVHWAKSYLGKANLVEITRRAYFRITERGRAVLQSPPSKIDNNFLKQFDEFRQFLAGSREPAAITETDGETTITAIEDQKQTPDETMRLAYRQIETALGRDLLDRIRKASPDFFERLIVNLLLAMVTADQQRMPAARSVARGTMVWMASLTRMPLASTVFIYKPSVMQSAITLVLEPFAIFSAAWIATKPARAYS